MKKILLFSLILITHISYSQQWEIVHRAKDIDKVFWCDEKLGWLLTDDDSLYRTDDAGLTWNIKMSVSHALYNDTTSLPKDVYKMDYGTYILGIHFTGKNGWLLMDGMDGGVMTSGDEGVSWQRNNNSWGPFDTSNVKTFIFWKYFFIDDMNGWAYGGCRFSEKMGLYKTTDGGFTWTNLDAVYYSDDPNKPDETNKLNSDAVEKIFFCDENHGWLIGDGLLLKTENGGKTWKHDQRKKFRYLQSVFFLNNEEGWLNDDYNLLHTTDGGLTYKNILNDTTYTGFTDIYFLNNQHGFVAIGERSTTESEGIYGHKGYGLLLETKDAGKTWQILIEGGSPFPAFTRTGNTLYTCNREFIYKYQIK